MEIKEIEKEFREWKNSLFPNIINPGSLANIIDYEVLVQTTGGFVNVEEQLKFFIRSKIEQIQKDNEVLVNTIMDETKKDIREAEKRAVIKYDRGLFIGVAYGDNHTVALETIIKNRKYIQKELGIKEGK